MQHTKLIFGILLSMNFSLSSCTRVYFARPQPIDSNNRYKFPRSYRGSWTMNTDTSIISKKELINISYKNKKLAKSVFDTSRNYFIKNNKIYHIKQEDKVGLSQGMPFKIKNDTLFFREQSTEELNLNTSAFIRKVGNNYIINQKRDNNWWEITLLQKTKSGNILIKSINKVDLKKISNFKLIDSLKDSYFSDAAWSKKELDSYINKGLFSDTLFFLPKVEKL